MFQASSEKAESKRCPSCLFEKAIDEFPPTRIAAQCKPCLKAYKHRHYLANIDAYKGRAADASKRDPEYKEKARLRAKSDPKSGARKAAYKERHKERVRLQAATYRAKYKDRLKESQREYHARNPHVATQYAADYRFAKKAAVPPWAESTLMKDMYKLASIYRDAGLQVEIDHIVPLQSEIVCGLHCFSNLQVLPMDKNRQKGNRWWPDMP